jgi:hypothetical protein
MEKTSMPRGPNFIVTFLYYFSTTTLIVLLIASQGMGMSLQQQLPYQLGTLCGLVAGIFGSYFNRSQTIFVSFQNQKAFTKKLDEALAKLGFEPKDRLEDMVVYSKNSVQTLFSGKILVKIDQNSATIVGRSSNLKRLQNAI